MLFSTALPSQDCTNSTSCCASRLWHRAATARLHGVPKTRCRPNRVKTVDGWADLKCVVMTPLGVLGLTRANCAVTHGGQVGSTDASYSWGIWRSSWQNWCFVFATCMAVRLVSLISLLRMHEIHVHASAKTSTVLDDLSIVFLSPLWQAPGLYVS